MKNILILSLTLLVSGCYKIEHSEVLKEPAEIVEVVYTPSRHGSGMGVGMSMSGNMVVTTNSVDIPEVHAVVFQCEHGKFIIKRKEIWARAKPGMKVTVSYREVYKVTEKERKLVDYDFLDFEERN